MKASHANLVTDLAEIKKMQERQGKNTTRNHELRHSLRSRHDINIGRVNRQESVEEGTWLHSHFITPINTEGHGIRRRRGGSATPRMHFQMWILAQSLNVNVPATTTDLFKLFAFFRPPIFSGFPDRLDDGENILS